MADTPRSAMHVITEWRGGMKVLIWIGGVGVPLAFGGLGFLHGQVTESTRTNSVQDTQIDALKERAGEDRRTQEEFQKRIDAKLDRLLERGP